MGAEGDGGENEEFLKLGVSAVDVNEYEQDYGRRVGKGGLSWAVVPQQPAGHLDRSIGLSSPTRVPWNGDVCARFEREYKTCRPESTPPLSASR